MKIKTSGENETVAAAKKYAATLKRGDIVLLKGDLGAGKTAFIKGAAEYFGIYDVTSPTYAYLNVYGGFIYHYDCYRLTSGEEAEAMGLTEYFGGDNVCFIEWAENIESALPQGCRQVVIEKTGEREREITL